MPTIRKTPPSEFHAKMALRYDQAAVACASQLSTIRDAVARERLAAKIKRNQEQAAFHRNEAEKLRGED